MNMKSKYLMSINRTSECYGIPRDRMRNAIKSGNTEIPYVKVGNKILINTIALERLLDEKAANQEELF